MGYVVQSHMKENMNRCGTAGTEHANQNNKGFSKNLNFFCSENEEKRIYSSWLDDGVHFTFTLLITYFSPHQLNIKPLDITILLYL